MYQLRLSKWPFFSKLWLSAWPFLSQLWLKFPFFSQLLLKPRFLFSTVAQLPPPLQLWLNFSFPLGSVTRNDLL
jgi:hypothetical protein